MSSWECDSTTTNIEIKYIYKSSVFPLSPKPTLTNGTITLAVKGGVTSHTLDSTGVWVPDKNCVIWKLSPIQPSDNECECICMYVIISVYQSCISYIYLFVYRSII